MMEALHSFAPFQRSMMTQFQLQLPCSNSLTNQCWQETIASLQQYVTTENIQSAFNYILARSGFIFDMMNGMMKFIATTEDFTCLSCSYDIIANDELDWDSNKPTFA